MLYLVALFIPPLAILLCGKVFQAILNLIIWIVVGGATIMSLGIASLGLLVPVIHALFVVHGAKADKRNEQLINAMKDD